MHLYILLTAIDDIYPGIQVRNCSESADDVEISSQLVIHVIVCTHVLVRILQKYIFYDENPFNLTSSSFYPTALKGFGILFSPMASGWAGSRACGQAAANILSRLDLRN